MVSTWARAYTGLGAEPQCDPGGRAPVEDQGEKHPHEAKSSVAFEAPVEETSLTLVTDSFLQFI